MLRKLVSTHQVVQKYDGDVASGIPPTYVLSEAVYDEGRGLGDVHWELVALGNLLDVTKAVVRRTALVAKGELLLRRTSRNGGIEAYLSTPRLYLRHWLEEFERCRLIPLQGVRDAKQTGESPLSGEIGFVGPKMRVDPVDLPAVFDEWMPSDQANLISPVIEVEQTVTRSFTPDGTTGFFFWKTADGREMVWSKGETEAMLIRDIADCLTEADQAGLVTSLMRKQLRSLKERPEIDWNTHEVVFRRDPRTERESEFAEQVRQGQKMSLKAFAGQHCEECAGAPTEMWEGILTDRVGADPLCVLATKVSPKGQRFRVSPSEGSRIRPVALI